MFAHFGSMPAGSILQWAVFATFSIHSKTGPCSSFACIVSMVSCHYCIFRVFIICKYSLLVSYSQTKAWRTDCLALNWQKLSGSLSKLVISVRQDSRFLLSLFFYWHCSHASKKANENPFNIKQNDGWTHQYFCNGQPNVPNDRARFKGIKRRIILKGQKIIRETGT